uniref:Retrotrans_gag domain-containing protein n=1 Tax=Globodera pallida TaxID=36090 RepID=A0A183CIF7_GLOPA
MTPTGDPGGSGSDVPLARGPEAVNAKEKDDELAIVSVDRKFWQGKTSVKVADMERAQAELGRLEDAVNRAFRLMNRTLNLKVNWVNTVVSNSNANFETLKAQIDTLAERMEDLENDRNASSRDPSLAGSRRRESNGDFVTPLAPRQDGQQGDEGEDEGDNRLVWGLNMLSGGTVGSNLEMFGEESAFAFDEWAERFKDYLSISGKTYSESEKVTRFKLALKDTPRALFKELLPVQTANLDSALAALRAKLDSPQRREVAKRTLTLSRQREDESVAQFLRRLTPLVEASNPSLNEAQRKEKVCEEFLDRLKPNMSFLIRLVGLTQAKDLDIVKAQAEELEALLLMNRGDDANRLSQARLQLAQTLRARPGATCKASDRSYRQMLRDSSSHSEEDGAVSVIGDVAGKSSSANEIGRATRDAIIANVWVTLPTPWRSVRAEWAIPKRILGFFYYEVTILEQAK